MLCRMRSNIAASADGERLHRAWADWLKTHRHRSGGRIIINWTQRSKVVRNRMGYCKPSKRGWRTPQSRGGWCGRGAKTSRRPMGRPLDRSQEKHSARC